ncbi:MAG TPA: hypothetical protein VM051_00695 [Usitatibacter sp.]|nr:hypothetical protein [Usitatibacter sp.]
MKRIIFSALAMLALAIGAAGIAAATPHFHDGNDLWIDPNESGWGLNLFHQGDTLFASLFVYGPDGKARWYTGSSLVGTDAGRDRATVYTGALYESTGPAVTSVFDPSRVTRRQVGTMSIELGSEGNPSRNYAQITYDVDGVRVTKHAYPFSFVAMGLSGSYTGYQASPGGARDEMNANVALNNGSFAMSTTNSVGTSCTYSGPQNANGSVFHVAGSYSCTDGRSGSFVLRDVDVTQHGFSAKLSNGTSMTDMVALRTSTRIRGDGYRTDLWLKRSESGWGLNIIEQGDTLFGTLFVYDAEGKPRWYSASNLAYEQCAPPDAASDCNGRYRGALFESTGPYFGTSFNAAAVTRRQVGMMKMDTYANDTAHLEFTIDGVTVVKNDLRRFAFRTNSLAGSYAGHITSLENNDRGMQVGAMTIEVSYSGDLMTVTMRGSRGTCTITDRAFQYGRQVSVSGAYDCGGPKFGRLLLSDLYVTWSGFTGRVDFGTDPAVNVFYPIGRIEAVRTAPH